MLFKVIRLYLLAFPREFQHSCAPVARNVFSNDEVTSRADRLQLSTVSIGGDVCPMRSWRVPFRAPSAPVASALKRRDAWLFQVGWCTDNVVRHSDARLSC